MLFYLDASALVKHFVEETGSAWVVGICNATAGNVIATGLISKAEVIAALATKQRNGTLSQTNFEIAEQSLTHDFRHRHTVVSVDEALIDHAATLAKSRKLRGYDAVQLASALKLNAILTQAGLIGPVFVCADNILLRGAQEEGLIVDNPLLHP